MFCRTDRAVGYEEIRRMNREPDMSGTVTSVNRLQGGVPRYVEGGFGGLRLNGLY